MIPMRARGGFSLIEVLAALAILTVLSAALVPLLANTAARERSLRLRLEARHEASRRLTALYLGLPESEDGPFHAEWRLSSPAPGGPAWSALEIVPENETRPAVIRWVRSGR